VKVKNEFLYTCLVTEIQVALGEKGSDKERKRAVKFIYSVSMGHATYNDLCYRLGINSGYLRILVGHVLNNKLCQRKAVDLVEQAIKFTDENRPKKEDT